MNTQRVARLITIVMSVVAALSMAGLIALTVRSSLDYDKFGEIPVPGSGVIDLPEGEVIVSFHVRTSSRGTAVPPLTLSIEPPPGGRDPQVTDELGDSVQMNNDVRRQVWIMQVPAAGRYPVSVDGAVADFEEPRLAFGRQQAMDATLWVLVAVSMFSADMAVAGWLLQRHQRKSVKPSAPTDPYLATDEGVRLEQLKTIAALRDSGAMTESEFEEEKRRILDGDKG